MDVIVYQRLSNDLVAMFSKDSTNTKGIVIENTFIFS